MVRCVQRHREQCRVIVNMMRYDIWNSHFCQSRSVHFTAHTSTAELTSSSVTWLDVVVLVGGDSLMRLCARVSCSNDIVLLLLQSQHPGDNWLTDDDDDDDDDDDGHSDATVKSAHEDRVCSACTESDDVCRVATQVTCDVQSADWWLTHDNDDDAVPSARRQTSAAICSDHFLDFSLSQHHTAPVIMQIVR